MGDSEDRLSAMGVLAQLGLDRAEGSVLLVDPPAEVAAEAGGLTPRPGVASSIQVARPAAHIAWWPTADQLSAATISRLGWLASAGGGDAWVVVSTDDQDAPDTSSVREAMVRAGWSVGEERALSSGELAVQLGAPAAPRI
jgi:hypothetical protein